MAYRDIEKRRANNRKTFKTYYEKHKEEVQARSREYRRSRRGTAWVSWNSMKKRCLNPKTPGYHNYGGRGITICDRWLESYANFLGDMGERPEGTTLDRIDVDGNYEPGNCRWATRMEQRHNRRATS